MIVTPKSTVSKKSTVTGQVYALSLLEYCIALDAACAWCAAYAPTHIICQNEALLPEISQRLEISPPPAWQSMLWIEPQAEDWQEVLESLEQEAHPIAHLAVILSLPPARATANPLANLRSSLGVQPGGIRRFRRLLQHQGFHQQDWYGIHTAQSALLFFLAERARRMGLFALGDRLEFTARLHYTKPLAKAWLATCALVLASRT